MFVKCSIMVNPFENLLSARAVIDSLSSIVSIDHFKTGLVPKFLPQKVKKCCVFFLFSEFRDEICKNFIFFSGKNFETDQSFSFVDPKPNGTSRFRVTNRVTKSDKYWPARWSADI